MFLHRKLFQSCALFSTISRNLKPIKHGSIWYGPRLQTADWKRSLSDFEIAVLSNLADSVIEKSSSVSEIDLNALSTVLGDGATRLLVAKSGLQSTISTVSGILHNGIGFNVIHGLSTNDWSLKKLGVVFLIMGSLMGNLRQQNAMGHVLGHVKDLGLSSSDPRVRVYQTSERQTFHTDSCDVVALLCLNMAKSGGLSSLVSCGTIFNEMLKINPELAYELLQPVPTDRRGEIPPGCLPYYMIPVLNSYLDTLTCIYQRQYIDSSQRLPTAPRLTPSTIAALDLFDQLADNPQLNFTTQLYPGDMLFCYNHTLLHDRTAFQDHEDEERARHLFRIWLATNEARPLPEVFKERFGSVTIGDRGGVHLPGVQPVATLNATKLAH